MNHFFRIVLLVTINVSIFSCKKDENPANPNQDVSVTLLDPVDEELNSLLASVPTDTTIKATDLKFDDGSSIIEFLQQNDPTFLQEHNVMRIAKTESFTPAEQKKLLIGRMEIYAYFLVLRKNWSNSQISNQPNGLAYNWGSKNELVAKKPANYPRGSSTTNVCQESLFGLDCSGMVYRMALAAGIDMGASGASAEFLRDISNWNKKLSESTTYKDLKAKLYKHSLPIGDPAYIDIGNLKDGDLIFKIGDGGSAIHVGMVLDENMSGGLPFLSIFQSNGKPNLGCDVNKSDTCGPRIISPLSSKAFGAKTLFGKDWQVVRFETGDCPTTVTDIDGNVYNTVSIGTQCWMKENLKTSKYRDGSAIPTGLDSNSWQNTTSGAYAVYDNNPANNTTYGKLYNWYAVADPRGLCPVGWHVPSDMPSDAEWTTLENFLGGVTVAGGKMKTTTGWTLPNTAATNESGFSGLPSGYRFVNGEFDDIGTGGYWWYSIDSSARSWARGLNHDTASIFSYYGGPKVFGFSVRCIRD